MKLAVKNHGKRLIIIGVLSLAIVGVSTGLAFKMHPFASAASTQNASVNDGETKDDSATTTTNSVKDTNKDGETKDDSTKSASANVQDNGQDGETNDSAAQ